MLIKKIGDIDSYIKNSSFTLLVYSILKGNELFTEYLVKLGCDLQRPYYTIKTGQIMYGGIVVSLKSPFDLVIESNNSKIINIFKKMNAKSTKQLIEEDESYGKYISKIFSEKGFQRIFTSNSVDLKEFPREKSMTITTIPKQMIVYILDQSEKVLSGDHYLLWYLICTKDGNIGWVKNSQLYYPSEM